MPLTFAADSFDSGFTNNNAGDTGKLQSVRIDTLPANGTLKLGANAATATAVTAGQIIARAELNTLTFVPVADFNGADSFGYNASDGTLFAPVGASVNLTINAVNDAPSFTVGGNQSVANNAGAQSVTGFVTGISAGPADESAQKVSFVVTNDNNALFGAQPSIDADGTLTYTPALGQTGNASVSVQAKDDGGVANEGVDTSAAQSFTITIVKANTAPTLNNGVFSAALNKAFSIRSSATTPMAIR